jgi:hypothetical protein
LRSGLFFTSIEVTRRVVLPARGTAIHLPMKRALVPAAILVPVAACAAILPARDTILALSVAAFVASLTLLAWWLVFADRGVPACADAETDVSVAESLEEDWGSFEREFWAHVAEHETTSSDLD